MNEKNNQNNSATFGIKGQYIKDLSFESPNSPESLIASNNQPRIEVNVELKARNLQESLYETTIFLTARAIIEDKTVFLIELSYAGIFEISNIDEKYIEPVLMIDCPFILFPFARRIIADVTRDGGFPPLMLDPIDFRVLYEQNRTKSSASSN
ncbi:MAG: protein-export chaperone SecB [Rickettsiales bacterium]